MIIGHKISSPECDSLISPFARNGRRKCVCQILQQLFPAPWWKRNMSHWNAVIENSIESLASWHGGWEDLNILGTEVSLPDFFLFHCTFALICLLWSCSVQLHYIINSRVIWEPRVLLKMMFPMLPFNPFCFPPAFSSPPSSLVQGEQVVCEHNPCWPSCKECCFFLTRFAWDASSNVTDGGNSGWPYEIPRHVFFKPFVRCPLKGHKSPQFWLLCYIPFKLSSAHSHHR